MRSCRRWTKEEIAYFRQIMPGNHTRQEFADMLNARFDTNVFTPTVVKNRMKHEDGTTGYSPKGRHHSPRTEFSKGQPVSGAAKDKRREIGTDVMRADGYLWRKTKRWPLPGYCRPAHVAIWEEANGPVPRGFVVIFLDSNRRNLAVENLSCVSRAELVRLNQDRLIREDPEMTKAGVLVAKLKTKAGKLRREQRR